MKLATWNVNSIKARHDIVLKWLENVSPDMLMIQELKGIEDNFPFEAIKNLGYHSYVSGQKTYNGVATMSKTALTPVHKSLPNYNDPQARFIDCVDDNGTHFINVYCPNGNPVDTEKYPYKLEWMEHLYTYLKVLRQTRTPFIIGGDFNIIPEDKDCHDPAAWQGDALFCPDTHVIWRKLLNLGMTDTFRIFDQAAQRYTFWDYQAGAWPQNKGIRIDHFLLPPALADKAISCTIDTDPRGWDKPSDHTPLVMEIDL